MPLDPRTFPRPPALERITKHILIRWPNTSATTGATTNENTSNVDTATAAQSGSGSDGSVIAETNDAYWVLETYHAPTYYIPRSALKQPLLPSPSSRRTMCEWKGLATYHAITDPRNNDTVHGRIWSYEKPSATRFEPIAGYLSFYASADVPWECFVDGEKVEPQGGSFYGGWVTPSVIATDKRDGVKGRPGTEWW